MAFADSTYVPSRPRWFHSLSSTVRSGVRDGCGAFPIVIVLTFTPRGTTSFVSDATKPMRPALAAA